MAEKLYKVIIVNKNQTINNLDYIINNSKQHYCVNKSTEDYQLALKTYKYVISPNVIGVLKSICPKFIIELIEIKPNKKYDTDNKGKKYLTKVLRKRIY